jgi:YesN/AraC family two-component response regulator
MSIHSDPEELGQLRRLSVLYAEDDEGVQKQLAKFLQRRVGKLFVAANGQEGLEIYRREKPDIVITDVSMPIMGGMEMAEAIKSDNEDTPVILTTAYNEPDFFIRSIEIGIDKYVVKPVNPDALMNALVKSAEALIRHRLIDAQNRMICLVLDKSPDFMVLIKNDHFEYVNKAFLTYLGYESPEAFEAAHEESDEFCEVDGRLFTIAQQADCIHHVIDHPGQHEVRIFGGKRHEAHDLTVSYEFFPELGKHLLSFKPEAQAT